jgi:RNA polymerase sigma-70 factor (ECF subfamily)
LSLSSFNDEKELLLMLSKGEEEAIKAIFELHYEDLCLYAESIIKNHQAAEELVEDLFVHIWLSAKTAPINTSVKNYLFKSTYNNCLKYLNRLKIENKLIDRSKYIFEDREILASESASYPLSNLLVNELKEKAGIILTSLPDQCRLIYSLSRFEDLSYSEIAKKLNINVGTVKTQMSRAFQKFRIGLKEYLTIFLVFFFYR